MSKRDEPGTSAEQPQPESKLAVEIAEFTIDTSPEDILAKRSAFNPYPEKAGKGISVWAQEPDTSTPNISTLIRYKATHEMYVTYVPLVVPIPGPLNPPRLVNEEPTPLASLKTGEIYGWRTFNAWLPKLSEALVIKDIRRSDYAVQLAQAVITHDRDRDHGASPVFKNPQDSYVSIVHAARRALDEGDWRAAIRLVAVGPHAQVYEVDGAEYSDAAFKEFMYTSREIAFDVCPTIASDGWGVTRDHGARDMAMDVAAAICGLVTTTIKQAALDTAIQESSTVIAKHRLQTARYLANVQGEDFKCTLRSMRSRLGLSYLDQVKQFFAAHEVEI